MTANERAQAIRIVRNLRTPERIIFELICELQDSTHQDGAAMDWDSVVNQLKGLMDAIPLIIGLARNIAREVRDTRGKRMRGD